MRTYLGEKVYISPKCITVVSDYERPSDSSRGVKLSSLLNLKKERTSNAISRKSKKRLMAAINWMVYSTPWKTVFSKKYQKRYKWKVNLITVTLPAGCEHISPKEFQENLLNPLLVNLRRNYGLKNYIWKLEPQQGGALHAHLTTDTWVHMADLQRMWNLRLQKCGYTKTHFEKFGNHNPPSTKVHSVKHIRNLGGYLAKYLAKTAAQEKTLKGRLWGCNYELSRVQDCGVQLNPEAASATLRPLLSSTMERKEIHSKPDAFGRTMQFATCFFPKARDWTQQFLGPIKQVFDEAVFYLRSGYETTPLLAYST